MDKPHPQYEVTHQEKRTEPDGKGGFHHVWHVSYQTPSGVASHVEIPNTHYTARNVHNLIADEMQHIEQVQSLGQGPPPEPPEPIGA